MSIGLVEPWLKTSTIQFLLVTIWKDKLVGQLSDRSSEVESPRMALLMCLVFDSLVGVGDLSQYGSSLLHVVFHSLGSWFKLLPSGLRAAKIASSNVQALFKSLLSSSLL